MPKALIVAFLFFTRIPMPRIDSIEPQDNGRALLFFPWVGLVIGLGLWALAALLSPVLSPAPLAAVLIIFWAAITGGLHLDGLADSADAWLAGGDQERSLSIMKDPRCGAAAVIAVVAILLLKYSALQVLLEQHELWLLILVPVLARGVSQLLFLTTAYARPQGIGQDFSEHAPRSLIRIQLIAIALVAVFLLGLTTTAICSIIAAALFYSLRRLMLKRLQGVTGDTAGALLEIVEAGLLLGLILVV